MKQAVKKYIPPATLTCHPRPRANRRDSLSQQLQMADTRGIATVVRELIQNQGVVRGLPILAVLVTLWPLLVRPIQELAPLTVHVTLRSLEQSAAAS